MKPECKLRQEKVDKGISKILDAFSDEGDDITTIEIAVACMNVFMSVIHASKSMFTDSELKEETGELYETLFG